MERSILPASLTPDAIRGIQNSEPTTADLTPLIDTICQIIFLLLAMLIGSSVIGSLPVKLPAVASSTTVAADNQIIRVSIDNYGNVYIENDPVSPADLERALGSLAVQGGFEKVSVRADAEIAYGRLAAVLSTLSRHLPGRQVDLVVQKADSSRVPEDSPRKEASKP